MGLGLILILASLFYWVILGFVLFPNWKFMMGLSVEPINELNGHAGRADKRVERGGLIV